MGAARQGVAPFCYSGQGKPKPKPKRKTQAKKPKL
jgi:hypothetical protein